MRAALIIVVVGVLMTTQAFALSVALFVLAGCGGDITPNASDAAVDAASDVAKLDSAKADASLPVPIHHRPTAIACPTDRGPGPPTQPYPKGQASGCMSDSDCTAGKNGRCFPFEGLVGPGGCSYDQCFIDSTCGPTTPCICRASATDNAANVCDTGGNCAVDSDCGPGGYCSPNAGCSSSPAAYFCHTAKDECVNDDDCPPVDADATSCAMFSTCNYDSQLQYWACAQLTCCPP